MTVRTAFLVLVAVGALSAAAVARAALDDEKALAHRYAPVIRLVAQEKECGPGEPYQPMDVNSLFGEPTVALKGPWSGSNLVKIGPTAKDLSEGLYQYHLDFPGNALQPGCDYERWARRVMEGHEPTVYAHVATDRLHPGKLALQYWLFYAYNDWNNLHEGDWEMIQLDFDAADAPAALASTPTRVGYSQHEGAERATWGSSKLELVDGTHPVVYPAAGSHANFFEEGLFLGSSASQGVGCDNTTGPHYDVLPVVATIPSDPALAREQFPWIGFEGRWGELQPSFFNGPTGPNLKTQWTEPIQWSEGWRDRSFTVPTASLFGTTATDFFCRVIGSGSSALVRLVHRPLEFTLVVGALVLLLIYALSRTSWRPATPLRLAHRRAWGQTLAAAARMYGRELRLVVGIGLLFIPVALLVALLQTLLLRGTSVVGVESGSGGRGFLAFVAIAIGTALTLLGLGLVQAATARALVEVDSGRPIGPLHAYWLARDSIRPLLGALVFAALVVSFLAGSIYLLPIAVWLAGQWALIAPSIELEHLSAVSGLRRSWRLVRGKWFKATSLIVVGGALAFVIGPIVGVALILTTGAPFWLVNLVAGVVYALTMPLVAITTAYVYFDRRVAYELGGDVGRAELPAEIEVAL
ncbi:MAG TPA: hypothetical protein VLB89_03755 [Gaiellaceae bacterium]|nr:hypothetical protein [Gaiellaceae bacterium]